MALHSLIIIVIIIIIIVIIIFYLFIHYRNKPLFDPNKLGNYDQSDRFKLGLKRVQSQPNELQNFQHPRPATKEAQSPEVSPHPLHTKIGILK